jgi:hypothetical protein
MSGTWQAKVWPRRGVLVLAAGYLAGDSSTISIGWRPALSSESLFPPVGYKLVI